MYGCVGGGKGVLLHMTTQVRIYKLLHPRLFQVGDGSTIREDTLQAACTDLTLHKHYSIFGAWLVGDIF